MLIVPLPTLLQLYNLLLIIIISDYNYNIILLLDKQTTATNLHGVSQVYCEPISMIAQYTGHKVIDNRELWGLKPFQNTCSNNYYSCIAGA